MNGTVGDTSSSGIVGGVSTTSLGPGGTALRLIAVTAVVLLVLAGAAFVGPALEGEQGAFIFWQLRVPRVLAGLLVGGTLSLVGAVFQALFANPLATPSTVGTTAGATLGALAVLALDIVPRGAASGLPIVTLAAFAGALGASLIVAGAAASGRARIHEVLLAGIAVTLATSALSTGLQYTADMRALFAAAQWSLGHLPQVGYHGAFVVAPFVIVSAIVLLSQTRALQALAIDEELAQAQGVDVRRVRVLALVTGSLGVAACVAWCGPIAFVGLIVPHLVRLCLGGAQRIVLPMSLVAGAGFLVACDTLGRFVLPDRELPVGVVTAALGAPALVLLIARRRSSS
jgi:ABC-type Fe3+-siderophore transport system permease subunit